MRTLVMVATAGLLGLASVSLLAKDNSAGAITGFVLMAAVLYLYAS